MRATVSDIETCPRAADDPASRVIYFAVVRIPASFTLMFFLSANVWAGNPPNDEVKAQVRKATGEYNLGQYLEAARDYEAAYLQTLDPNLLFNVAQAYRLAGENTSTAATPWGTGPYVQILSVRQTARQCGHIPVSGHFKAWANLSTSLTLGKMYEAMLVVEVGGGLGTIDFTTGTVTAQ